MNALKKSIKAWMFLGRYLTGIVAGCAMFFSIASADEIKYDSAGRRDPMIPLVDPNGKMMIEGAPTGTGDFHVEGIIYDPKEGSYALINGQFFKEGDAVENANIVSIMQDRVVLSVNDAEKIIWLREEVVANQ